ncbi:uncharacterized protein ColSpa_09543 [Colletotrichum spaethianum]|uniref:Uncharacterized protein n=1 Tax=Colletotrichum spaethianum TaxID=700344 RepID=A0AA37PBW0_9PEZI|nr:uncharacterized protein ColSpa_09543 [Colletotrichum spaethianum]GKT49362.1 hypothetical protein ColSpa_09543 [Colletotrichum spaethianum]
MASDANQRRWPLHLPFKTIDASGIRPAAVGRPSRIVSPAASKIRTRGAIAPSEGRPCSTKRILRPPRSWKPRALASPDYQLLSAQLLDP